MRHLVRGRKLGRTKAHRKATMQALCVALVREKRIQTTVAKAKELRRYIEPLVTRAKVDSQHNRRLVFGELQDKLATQELFDTIGPKVGDRPGGYTRVLKTGFRGGDAAEMALIELIDFNESEDSTSAKPKRSRRSRRGGGSSAAAKEATAAKKDEVAEESASDAADATVDAVEQAEVEVVEEAADTKSSVEEATAAQEVAEETTEATDDTAPEASSEESDDASEEKKDA